MKFLSKDEILKNGIEFAGEVCYSGEYGEQVYTKEMDEGGIPVEGILYERYDNGNIIYYEFCKEGISNGPCVYFYENGRVINEKKELLDYEKSIYEKREKIYKK